MSSSSSRGVVKGKGKPRGVRRDRDCFTCRRRNVKCDLNRPACTPCVEDGLQCAGYPTRIIWSNKSNTWPQVPGPSKRNSSVPQASTSQAEPQVQVGRGDESSTTSGTQTAPTSSGTSEPTTAEHSGAATGASSDQTIDFDMQPSNVLFRPGDNGTGVGVGGAHGGRTSDDGFSKQVLESFSFGNEDRGSGADKQQPPAHESSSSMSPVQADAVRSSLQGRPQERFNEFNEGQSQYPMAPLPCQWTQQTLEIAYKNASMANSVTVIEGKAVSVDRILYVAWQVSRSIVSGQFGADMAHNLEELKTYLTTDYIEALFVTQALLVYEIVCGSIKGCRNYLITARTILEIHCGTGPLLDQAIAYRPPIGSCLAQFCFYDTVNACVKGESLMFSDHHRSVMSNDFFQYCGLEKKTFISICTLLDTVRGILRPHHCESHAFLEALNDVLASVDGDLVFPLSTMNGWRMANLLIALDLHYTGHYQDQVFQNLVDKICKTVVRIPKYSEMGYRFLLPMFVAGTNARNDEHKVVIRSYFLEWDSSGFSIFSEILELLERAWQER
uniref:ARAD1C17116p n=1 Tax=Blastobotrys adeninivorans TaxID=409370 RepID=A0A060T0L5_BLAAD